LATNSTGAATAVALILWGLGCTDASEDTVEVLPSPSADVVFIDEGRVWVMAADGSEAEALADGAGVGSSPRWSPDGHRIAYLEHRAATKLHRGLRPHWRP
jgi:Tol biopolymer transport system component